LRRLLKDRKEEEKKKKEEEEEEGKKKKKKEISCTQEAVHNTALLLCARAVHATCFPPFSYVQSPLSLSLYAFLSFLFTVTSTSYLSETKKTNKQTKKQTANIVIVNQKKPNLQTISSNIIKIRTFNYNISISNSVGPSS